MLKKLFQFFLVLGLTGNLSSSMVACLGGSNPTPFTEKIQNEVNGFLKTASLNRGNHIYGQTIAFNNWSLDFAPKKVYFNAPIDITHSFDKLAKIIDFKLFRNQQDQSKLQPIDGYLPLEYYVYKQNDKLQPLWGNGEKAKLLPEPNQTYHNVWSFGAMNKTYIPTDSAMRTSINSEVKLFKLDDLYQIGGPVAGLSFGKDKNGNFKNFYWQFYAVDISEYMAINLVHSFQELVASGKPLIVEKTPGLSDSQLLWNALNHQKHIHYFTYLKSNYDLFFQHVLLDIHKVDPVKGKNKGQLEIWISIKGLPDQSVTIKYRLG